VGSNPTPPKVFSRNGVYKYGRGCAEYISQNEKFKSVGGSFLFGVAASTLLAFGEFKWTKKNVNIVERYLNQKQKEVLHAQKFVAVEENQKSFGKTTIEKNSQLFASNVEKNTKRLEKM